MEDNTPLYEVLFEMEVDLCERFPAMTPLSLRREKAREVFLLIARLNQHSRHKKKTTKSNVIRKPAGDNWF